MCLFLLCLLQFMVKYCENKIWKHTHTRTNSVSIINSWSKSNYTHILYTSNFIKLEATRKKSFLLFKFSAASAVACSLISYFLILWYQLISEIIIFHEKSFWILLLLHNINNMTFSVGFEVGFIILLNFRFFPKKTWRHNWPILLFFVTRPFPCMGIR